MKPICPHWPRQARQGENFSPAAGDRCLDCWATLNYPADWTPPVPRKRVTSKAIIQRILVARREGGPGTELKALLASLGIHPKADCGCLAMMQDMDRAGAELVKVNRQAWLERFRKNAAAFKWSEKLTGYAAAGLVTAGRQVTAWLTGSESPAWYSPTDPYPGLLDEAIRRAEAKEQA